MNKNLFLLFFVVLATRFLPLPSLTWATPMVEVNEFEPLIVLDDQGNILEIQQKQEEFHTQIQAQTYHQETNKWSPSIDLSTLGMNAHNPKIATDPNGNALAIWQVTDGIYECVQASYYNASTDKWSPAENLTPLEKDLVVTHVAMNEHGNGFAAWKHGENTRRTVTFSKKSNKWEAYKTSILPPKKLNALF